MLKDIVSKEIKQEIEQNQLKQKMVEDKIDNEKIK